jgi:hypothetical protein
MYEGTKRGAQQIQDYFFERGAAIDKQDWDWLCKKLEQIYGYGYNKGIIDGIIREGKLRDEMTKKVINALTNKQ